MKFVILGKDGPEGTAKRPLFREAHLQRLDQWAQQGKIILAGPLTDKTGSLIVVEAESLEEVQAFAQNDPYMIHGVFQEVTIHPFMQVLPGEPQSGKT
ncbi:MAG: YciI family protein [Nitrospirota bacterium]|nr:YciI family protein [Nitrospirota bacterium]